MKKINYRKISIWAAIIGSILLLILAIFDYRLLVSGRSSSNNNTNESDKICLPRKIDGVCMGITAGTNPPLAAVIVENMTDARPQSGLNKANLVFEALAEAGITRFLAIYASSDKVSEIGPVRSARPYFNDWAREFGALYMHVGGSPEALQNIRQTNMTDIDQFFNGQYYWRSDKRSAPHNVYTSSDLIADALGDKNIDSAKNFESWAYKDEVKINDRPTDVKDLVIKFSETPYEARWRYDRLFNNYRRFEAGGEHLMADSEKIVSKNVVVQLVKFKILDEEGRRWFGITGTGKAIVFRDGEAIVDKWKKADANSRTKYYDENDKEIEFNRGNTWIEIVPDSKMLSY